MREEWWQPLVAPALCRTFDLRPELVYSEVPTREGSIIDLVYVGSRRILGFELKMAEPGGVVAPLNGRALRQLRHFGAACDQLYLVTVAAPRAFDISSQGHLLVLEPYEGQPVPDGVGWVMFDRLSQDTTVVRPAGEGACVLADRRFLLDQVLNRLGRAQREAKQCLA